MRASASGKGGVIQERVFGFPLCEVSDDALLDVEIHHLHSRNEKYISHTSAQLSHEGSLLHAITGLTGAKGHRVVFLARKESRVLLLRDHLFCVLHDRQGQRAGPCEPPHRSPRPPLCISLSSSPRYTFKKPTWCAVIFSLPLRSSGPFLCFIRHSLTLPPQIPRST